MSRLISIIPMTVLAGVILVQQYSISQLRGTLVAIATPSPLVSPLDEFDSGVVDPHEQTSIPKYESSPHMEDGYFADYAYSETEPDHKPASVVLASLEGVPEGTPLEEIKRASDAFGVDPTFMKSVAKIESDFDPKQRTGSYVGLYQLSSYEFNKYGQGSITDARDNAIAAAYKFAVQAKLFELETHKTVTPEYLYLIHQQGWEGAAQHVEHPERIAWESMCQTSEGREKGEKWCKRAIWENTLPSVKKTAGSVEKLTSGDFVNMWASRMEHFLAMFSGNTEVVSKTPEHKKTEHHAEQHSDHHKHHHSA